MVLGGSSIDAAGDAGEWPGVIASPERIRAWLELAKAGDEFIYATRAGTLPFGNEGARTVREMAGLGLIEAFQRPIADGVRNYVARRTKLSVEAVKRASDCMCTPRPEPHIDDEAAAIDALLPVLMRQAQFGRPCATDAQLAERAGLRRSAVAATLEAMANYGVIRMEKAPPPTLRRVTIVATGHRTGMAA